MKEQNQSNHARYVPGYHFVALFLILVLLVMGIMRLCSGGSCTGAQCSGMAWMHEGLFEVIISVALGLVWLYERVFATKVQDRVIRAEENFRHFIMTGKPLDAQLSMGQIIALRFADDAEFLELKERVIKENMKPGDIKKAIKKWKADHYRA